MATGDIKLVYGTAADVTITLASLATSSTLLVGREATAVDNTTLLAEDYIISGKVTTGTSPTTAKSIQVWGIASTDNTSWPGVVTGSDAGLTFIAENKNSICRLVASMATVATSNQTYSFSGISIASVFGGTVPPKLTFFVTHDTAVNLNSTGSNHLIRVQPVYSNVAS